MIETILGIKLCLGIVFLIGLITGYQFIKALIREDFAVILKKFNQGIKENGDNIKEKTKKINLLNNNISEIRNNIKSLKDSVSLYENNLQDVEHIYFKLSDANNKITNEINDNKRVILSYKKEISYYQTLLNKNLENNLSDKIEKLEDEIEILNLNINKNLVKIQSLKEQKEINIDKIEEIRMLILEKDEEIEVLKNKIAVKNLELINKDKNFSLELEIDNLKEKLEIYKKELLSYKI